MGSIRLRRGAAFAFALALTLGACGGGPGGNTNDPVGTVQSAYSAASSGGIGKMVDFVCAAKKNDLAGAFGAGNLSALTAAGVKPEDLFGAMSISFANLNVTQTAKTDTTATVAVTGDTTITLDKEKMRTIMKTVLTSQGQAADDAMLDQVMTAMSSQMTQTTKMNDTVELVNEGGKWLICG